MRMMGSNGIKCLLTISLLLALSSCDQLDGGGSSNRCMPGQYWLSYGCRPCDQCHQVGEVQLSSCSATENTICITCEQFKIGMRCLTEGRDRFLEGLLRRQQAMEGKGVSILQHPCLAIDSRLLGQLNAKSRFELNRHWLACVGWREGRRVKISKREITATEMATRAPDGFVNTTVSTTPSPTDFNARSDSFDTFGALNPEGAGVFSSDIDGGSRKTIHQKGGSRRKSHRKGGKRGKGRSKGRNRDRNKTGRTHFDSDQNLDDNNVRGKQQHPEPGTHIAGEGDREMQVVPSGVSSKNGGATHGTNVPTSDPRLFGSNHFNVNHGAPTEIAPKHDADKPVNTRDSSSSSSSSSSWWLDHKELMYSLMAAVVVVVALFAFIASRLHASGKLGLPMTAKKVNVNVPEGDKMELECMEMGDLKDSVWKGSPVSTTDTAKPRNLVSYQSDTDLSKNKKFLLSHSHSSNLEISSKPADDSWIAALKSTSSLSNMDWLRKSSDGNSHNDYGSYHSEAETQTDRETVSHHSKTVFGTKWQFSGTFSGDGGVLQRDNSDVSLVVGRDAVLSGQYVTIHGAVFTDASQIRSKFGIESNEMLITPLVEYHAEGFYHFQNHVAVKLPHALPDDFDAAYIKFYTFSVDECGNISLESLPMKSKDNSSLDDADAFWEISNQGRIFIAKTKHFSGYFCTSCESKSKLPSVYARVFGSHIQIKSTRREVRLMLYLWDRRLNIKDFIEAIRQQECDMDRQLLADEPVPLLQNASSDSSIVMRMETLGDTEDQKLWRHVTRSNASRPLFKPLQVRRLRQIVQCCQQNDPMRVEWAMESVPGEVFPSNVFQCLIEMVHTPDGVTNYEDALLDADEENIRTFYVRNLKMAQPAPVTSEDVHSRQEFLKKAMTHVLDRRDMEGICLGFGINKKDFGNLSRKFDSDNALKAGLLDECSKKCGMDHFVQTLPQVLEQTQLYHVIEYLQDRDLLSTVSSYKQNGSSSITSHLQPSPVCLSRQLSESTVCKSISHPQFELESRQRQSPLISSNSSNSSSSVSGCGAGHNQLRLKINPNGQSVAQRTTDDGTQVSPDSDFNSPSHSPPRYQKNNNFHNTARDNLIVNISPITGDLNVTTVPKMFSHDSHNNSYNNDNMNNSPPAAATTNFNSIENDNSLVSDCPSSSQHSSSCSNSNNCSVSDDSDFDDSCLAVIDSMDLRDRSKETPLSDLSIDYEDTSRKELAASGQQLPKAKGVAYPEIPEERRMSRNESRHVSKMVTPVEHKDNKDVEEVSSHPSNSPGREDVNGDTVVKETYI